MAEGLEVSGEALLGVTVWLGDGLAARVQETSRIARRQSTIRRGSIERLFCIPQRSDYSTVIATLNGW